jgi:hypothetical protein
MSTPRCPVCGKNWWKYRHSGVTRGRYCSETCYSNRRRLVRKVPPETVAMVIEQFREHRLLTHQTRNLTEWFDCEVCERFEERYAVSMFL